MRADTWREGLFLAQMSWKRPVPVSPTPAGMRGAELGTRGDTPLISEAPIRGAVVGWGSTSGDQGGGPWGHHSSRAGGTLNSRAPAAPRSSSSQSPHPETCTAPQEDRAVHDREGPEC